MKRWGKKRLRQNPRPQKTYMYIYIYIYISADPFGVTRRVVSFLSPWPLLVSSPVAFQGDGRTVLTPAASVQIALRASWGASWGLRVTKMDPKGAKITKSGQKGSPQGSQRHPKIPKITKKRGRRHERSH